MEKKESKGDSDILKQLIQMDKSLSLSLSVSASKSSALGHFRPHMKCLEYSCHGVFWITGSIIGLWFSNSAEREAFFFNLLLALFLDILLVAILKAAIQRKRPDNNESEDMLMTWYVDKMSCPSGHTSRAVLLTYLLIISSPHLYYFHPVLLVWCICTCASRVLLGRHHLGDVLIGVALGYMEYLIMDYIWAGSETAKWYLDIFKDTSSVLDEL